MQFSGGGSQVGSAQITDNEIVDADINSAAAISANKIASLGYQKLGTKTLGAGATTLTTDAFAAKKYLRLMIDCRGSGAASINLRFNADSGANYDFWKALNLGTPTTSSGQTSMEIENGAESAARLLVVDILNVATVAKKVISRTTEAGEVHDGGGAWNNTTDQITAVTMFLDDVGDLAAGTTIDVYGMN